MVIALHQKIDGEGWQEVERHPEDSYCWTEQDLWAIGHLKTTGSRVLTMGATMWEVVS